MTDSTEPQHAAPAPTLGEKIAEYRKAIAGLVVPALLVLGGSVTEASDGGSTVTAYEWIIIAIAALGTSTLVGVIPNKPKA
jgi:hypothetical protein